MTLAKKEIEAMLEKMEKIGATKIEIYADYCSDYAKNDTYGYYIDYYNKGKYLEDEYKES